MTPPGLVPFVPATSKISTQAHPASHRGWRILVRDCDLRGECLWSPTGTASATVHKIPTVVHAFTKTGSPPERRIHELVLPNEACLVGSDLIQRGTHGESRPIPSAPHTQLHCDHHHHHEMTTASPTNTTMVDASSSTTAATSRSTATATATATSRPTAILAHHTTLSSSTAAQPIIT